MLASVAHTSSPRRSEGVYLLKVSVGSDAGHQHDLCGRVFTRSVPRTEGTQNWAGPLNVGS